MPIEDLSVSPSRRSVGPVDQAGVARCDLLRGRDDPVLVGEAGRRHLHRGRRALAVPDERLDREHLGVGEQRVEHLRLGRIALGGAGAVGVQVRDLAREDLRVAQRLLVAAADLAVVGVQVGRVVAVVIKAGILPEWCKA